MPAIALIIPLLFAVADQTGLIPGIPFHHKKAIVSYSLPEKTEVIYFVAY